MRATMGFLLALMWATAAGAVITPAGSNDVAKRALARQVIQAMGGGPRVEPLIQATLNRVLPAFPGAVNTPEKRKALEAIIPGLKQDFAVLMPKLMDVSIDTYSSVLTEQELRDYLAFLNSPSGRSITLKQPALVRQAGAREAPIINAAMPGLMTKMVDRICQVETCSAAERARFKAALDKATAPPSPH